MAQKFKDLKCCKCNVHVRVKPLKRFSPKGVLNPKWICYDCKKEKVPELISIIQKGE